METQLRRIKIWKRKIGNSTKNTMIIAEEEKGANIYQFCIIRETGFNELSLSSNKKQCLDGLERENDLKMFVYK